MMSCQLKRKKRRMSSYVIKSITKGTSRFDEMVAERRPKKRRDYLASWSVMSVRLQDQVGCLRERSRRERRPGDDKGGPRAATT